MALKPQNPVINWNNPLSKGLVLDVPIVEGGGTLIKNLVSKTNGVFAGTPNPTWKRSILGLGLDFLGTSSAGEAVYFTPNSETRGLIKYSIVQILMFRSAGANNNGCSYRFTDNSASMCSVRIFDTNANSILFTHTWTTTAGAWRVTGLTTNTVYHIVITYDGTNSANVPVMYVNGVRATLITTTSPTGTINTTADSQFILGNINQTGNVGTRTWDGQIYKTSLYNRILNDQEVKQLYEDPWQIYRTASPFNSLTAVPVNYVRNFRESILLTDSIGQIYDTNTQYDDHIFYNSSGVSNISRVLGWNRSQSDLLALADYLVGIKSAMVFLYDTIQLQDSFIQSVAFNQFLVDTANLQDFLTKSIQYFRSKDEVLAVQDTITYLTSIAIKLYDSVGLADSATTEFVKNLFLQEDINLTDYFSYINNHDVDNDTAPSIDILIFKPLPYTEPDKMILFSTDEAPISAGLNFSGGGEYVLKQYDSHTIYNKHIPYYDAIGTDEAPTILTITDRP